MAAAPRVATSIRLDELSGARADAVARASVGIELDLSHPHLRWLPVRGDSATAGYLRDSFAATAPFSTHAPHRGLDPLSPDPLLARYAVASLRRALRVTSALGADRMVLHSGLAFRRDAASALRYLERVSSWLRPLADEALGMGVALLLENTTEREPAWLLPLFEAVPSVGFCFDPAHAQAFSDVTEASAWLATLGHRFRHLHLSGTRRGTDLHLPLSAGEPLTSAEIGAWTARLPEGGAVVLETVPFEPLDAERVRSSWRAGRNGSTPPLGDASGGVEVRSKAARVASLQ